MALIKCPECLNEVSDQAISCPHCGYPLKKENKEKDLPDFSKMEVILYRGIRKSTIVWTEIVAPIAVVIILVAAIFFGIEGGTVGIALTIIFTSMVLLYIPIFIVAAVKFRNNSRLTHQNMYYDEDTQQFFLECWSRRIISLNARDEIRVGCNMLGFNETVVVHQGRRINTGFSSTKLKEANQRIQEIRESLK